MEFSCHVGKRHVKNYKLRPSAPKERTNSVYSVQAVSRQVTISHPPGGRLPLLSARPAVTLNLPSHRDRPLAGTKLYCLVTEAHRCDEQLAQACYATFAPSIEPTVPTTC